MRCIASIFLLLSRSPFCHVSSRSLTHRDTGINLVHHKDMFFLLLIILLTIFFVYIKLKYFTLYGPIPGKSPQFLVGNLLQTGLSNGRYIGDVAKEFQDKYGDTFHMWLALIHVIFVCNPDDVQHVFTHRHIYEQGDLHASQHRVVFNDALMCNIGSFRSLNWSL